MDILDKDLHRKISNILEQANEIVIGKNEQVRLLFAALISKSHVLIEDKPGKGKTTLVQAIGRLSGLAFSRVQFTNDLMPADILGFKFYDKSKEQFIFKKGPAFTDILLVDEINRGSPKTQSAFLQAMEERTVTLEGEHYELGDKFVVFATQNPMDQVGTHELPESQLDRFAISFSMGASSIEHERHILKRGHFDLSKIAALCNNSEFDSIVNIVSKISISEQLYDFVLEMTEAIRSKYNTYVSIRASQHILSLAKAIALFDMRDFITAQDLLFVAPYVYAHRVRSGHDIEYTIDEIKHLVQELSIPIKK